jgi:hypothetical protein
LLPLTLKEMCKAKAKAKAKSDGQMGPSFLYLDVLLW